jgi:p-aminobenzoyl-glutamate transporter AbgT
MREFIQKQWERKLAIGVLFWTVGTVIVIRGYIVASFTEWSNFTEWVLAIMLGAHVADKQLPGITTAVSTMVGGKCNGNPNA